MQHIISKHIDSLMLVTGAIVGIVTPNVVLSRVSPFKFATMDLLEFVSIYPWQGISAIVFAIAGFSLVAVGLRGMRGQFASPGEKLESLTVTLMITFVICVVAYVAVLALSKLYSFVEYQDFRLFATIIGALVGFQLAEQLPSVGENRTPIAFTIGGGLLGYFAAPAFLLFASVAALIFFGAPFLTFLRYKFSSQSSSLLSGNGPAPAADHKKQVHDLRLKIQWVKKSGVTPHLIKEEVARLTRQIHDLGGTP